MKYIHSISIFFFLALTSAPFCFAMESGEGQELPEQEELLPAEMPEGESSERRIMTEDEFQEHWGSVKSLKELPKSLQNIKIIDIYPHTPTILSPNRGGKATKKLLGKLEKLTKQNYIQQNIINGDSFTLMLLHPQITVGEIKNYIISELGKENLKNIFVKITSRHRPLSDNDEPREPIESMGIRFDNFPEPRTGEELPELEKEISLDQKERDILPEEKG